jgi:hypothetical protein
MMHESWLVAFVQGLIMGVGMMVAPGVVGIARVIARRAVGATLASPSARRSNRLAFARRSSPLRHPDESRGLVQDASTARRTKWTAEPFAGRRNCQRRDAETQRSAEGSSVKQAPNTWQARSGSSRSRAPTLIRTRMTWRSDPPFLRAAVVHSHHPLREPSARRSMLPRPEIAVTPVSTFRSSCAWPRRQPSR